MFPFYLDRSLRPFAVSHTQLYCNTPSDFDFRLDNPSLSVKTTLVRGREGERERESSGKSRGETGGERARERQGWL